MDSLVAAGVPSSTPACTISSSTDGLLPMVEHEHKLKHKVNGILGKNSVECMDVKANAKAKAAKAKAICPPLVGRPTVWHPTT